MMGALTGFGMALKSVRWIHQAIRLSICFIAFTSAGGAIPTAATNSTAAPVTFAFDRFASAPLKDISHGELLLGELNCVACHSASDSIKARLDSKQPPVLGQIASRVTEYYLRAFLTDPHRTKPATAMPDLLAGMDEAKKTETVDALVNFLATQAGPQEKADPQIKRDTIETGRRLYHTVGCVACHAPLNIDASGNAPANSTPLGD